MFSRSGPYYDALYSWKDYAGEAERLHELIQARSPGARTLLDVGCGTGKHLEALAERYDVAGVDLDPGLLAIARERLPDVPLHEADMTAFDLGRRFDAVVCLFSSIGYAKTRERLHAAVAAMARHLAPRGVLVVEPWILAEKWQPRVGALLAEHDELAIARINANEVQDGVSVLEMHHLVGTKDRVEHFVETHELGLWSHDEYLAAVRAARLAVEHDPEGLMGRGLYIGVDYPSQASSTG